jgi:hypothetical protein
MHDPADGPNLVRLARESTLSNCVEWVDDRTMLRVGNDPSLEGLSPVEIKRLLREYVRNDKTLVIRQKREDREPWTARRDYWYWVVIPVPGMPHGLFVEMELADDDSECPVVFLLNAHPERP